jgi:tol-pal system protein YbgF
MQLRAHVLLQALLAALAGGPFGCARTAEERQLDAMREDIDQIQHDRDRADLAAEPAEPQAERAAASKLPAAPAPTRDTVRVEPAPDVEDDDYADPEDTSPRPKIRVFGSTLGRGRRGEDQVEATIPDESTTGSALDPEAKRAYDAALSLVNGRQYGPALEALTAFLVRWPDHPYVDHAMYWRGECYFAQGDYARAAEQFEGVLARFPAGMKAPDALLKLGMCHQKLGHVAQARACFDRLVRDYPQSDAARHTPALTAEDRR